MIYSAVVGIRCVHYIEQKGCTARFATGGMRDSRLKSKSGTVDTSHTVGSVQGRAPLLYILYGIDLSIRPTRGYKNLL